MAPVRVQLPALWSVASVSSFPRPDSKCLKRPLGPPGVTLVPKRQYDKYMLLDLFLRHRPQLRERQLRPTSTSSVLHYYTTMSASTTVPSSTVSESVAPGVAHVHPTRE